MTDRTASPGERFNVKSAQNWHPLITEENGQSLHHDEFLGTNEMLTRILSTSDMMTPSETWTAGNTYSAAPSAAETTTFLAQPYEQEMNKCALFNIIVSMVLPCIFSFVGLIGNTLSMLIFWPDRHKLASSVLLLQLAIVDSLVLIIWTFLCVHWVLRYFTENIPVWVLAISPYTSAHGWPTAVLIQTIACWFIVCITMQRYIAVCYPHKMRLFGSVRVVWIQLVVLVICCVLFNIPRFLETGTVVLENGEVSTKAAPFLRNTSYQLYYRGMGYYFVNFIAPVILLIFFTASLIRHLKKSRIRVAAQSHQSTQQSTATTHVTTLSENSTKQSTKKEKKDNSITLSLVVVDIVFLLCQWINPIRGFTEYLLPPEQKVCGTAYSYFESLSGTGIFISSSVNFYIFCLCSKGYRKKVLERLCGT